MKKILIILLAVFTISSLMFAEGTLDSSASSSYDDSFLDAYNDAKNDASEEAKEGWKYFTMLFLATLNMIVAFMPIWILAFNTIKNISAAPLNEHYERIVQAEPISFYVTTMFVLVIAVAVWDLGISLMEVSFLKNHAPLMGPNGLTREIWSLEIPNEVSGRYGAITMWLMDGIDIIRELIKMLSAFTALLLLFTSAFFAWTYFSSIQTGMTPLSVAASSFVAIIAYILVSSLYDFFASPVLNTDETALSLARIFLQESIDIYMEGAI